MWQVALTTGPPSKASSQGSDLGTIRQDLVTKGTARLARKASGRTLGIGLESNQIVGALQDVEFGKDAQLHGGTGLFATQTTMTPNGQGRIAFDFAIKGTTHTRPSTSCHLRMY